MSQYDHMHDLKGIKVTCNECEQKFTWSEYGPFYLGGKDTEFIKCPYCGVRNGLIRTSGFVSLRKVEE